MAGMINSFPRKMFMFHKKLISYSSGQEISWVGNQAESKVKPDDKIFLKFMDCTNQNNSCDCGLYAITNAVSDLHILQK